MKPGVVFLFIIASVAVNAQQLDIQGHRGCRGLFPENTIPAFIRALDLGVTTIELDVVISKDGKVVVSHEPFLNPTICLDAEGNIIDNELQHNLYQMTYKEIAQCDCGSLVNDVFPEQEKIKVSKPLLSDVIKDVEWHIKSYTQFEVNYNIEIKSTVNGDGTNHPKPNEFSEIVYSLIDKYLPWERVIIQSFDYRVLKYWHKTYPKVRLSALVDNQKSIETNMANLGFEPDVYSSNYKFLDEEMVESLKKRNIAVIPWTVNDTTDMAQLVDWGVEGFITDYPNLAVELGYITIKKEE